MTWKPLLSGVALGLGLSLLATAPRAGERIVVEHAKEVTGAESGLQYRYTFKVTTHKSNQPVTGAEFTVATDMPSMPGAHHMPHVEGEPGEAPGSYHATIEFDMAGVWSLILRFRKPHRDQVVITDNVPMQPGGEGQKLQRTEPDHSGHKDHKSH